MTIHEIDRRVEAGEVVKIPGDFFGRFHQQSRHIHESRHWHLVVYDDHFTVQRADTMPVEPAPDSR